MIEIQFFLQNLHFALSLFAALVFFAAAWLYFDAWTVKKDKKDSLKILGLFYLCLSFVISATHIESTILKNSVVDQNLVAIISFALRVLGYSTLAIGLYIDPLQKRPGEEDNKKVEMPVLAGFGIGSVLSVITPVLAAVCGLLFLKRATYGLERHLRPVA
jgi:hypothetical protein